MAENLPAVAKFAVPENLSNSSKASPSFTSSIWNDRLIVEKMNNDAIIPVKGSPGAAGYDIFASEIVSIPAGETRLVPTKIMLGLPAGVYGRIAPRSGLALNHSIMVNGGVIDQDYRGEIGIILHNLGKAPFVVKRGDKIAQLILEQYRSVEIFETKTPGQLLRIKKPTTRGDKGFGSTGKNIDDT